VTQAHLGPWLIPGLNERLIELHALSGADQLSMQVIAEKLSKEFGVVLTKNSVIGRSHRLRLELRDNVPFVRKKVTPMPKRKYHRVDTPIAPVLEPRCEEIGISIYQLRDDDCHWPLGEMLDYPPFRYCGKASLFGRPYCKGHSRIAYNMPRERWA
jgi:hypothetical protein